MFKKKTKFSFIMLSVFLLTSTIVIATDEPVTMSLDTPVAISEENVDNSISTDETIDETTDDTDLSDLDIHNGDLFLAGTDVFMDQLVDGNVYLFGTNVTISGRVNGNLFVCGNNVVFTEDFYATNSVYIAANRLSFSGRVSFDLYAASTICDITANSFIGRDLKVAAGSLTFASGVGRDTHIYADSFTYSESENSVIYGNLNYSSKSEVTIPDGKVEGSVNYNKIVDNSDEDVSTSDIIMDYVISACTFILTSLVFYLLIKFCCPNFVQKVSQYASSKAILSFVVGLISIILIPIACIILFITGIGSVLGFILLALYIAVLLLGAETVVVSVSKKILEARNITAKYVDILVVALVSLVVWALEKLPYVGGIIGIILCAIGVGIILQSIFSKKEKTENVVSTESK